MITNVTIENYEGPLDLLIHLVHKNEMNIFNVPVAEITNHFVAEIRRMQELDMEVAAEFIHMASYLIYLKSRYLLPKDSTTGDEILLEEESFNLGQLIVELAYCKELAVVLKEQADISGKYLIRRDSILLPRQEQACMEAYQLSDAFFEATAYKPEDKLIVNSSQEQAEAVSAQTRKIILDRDETLWSELAGIFTERFDKAIAFTSILDMSKRQLIRSIQESNFSDILMQRLKAEAMDG